MALPVIQHPLFDVEIPSTKKKIKIRPMLVKEEKLLLMAKVGGTNADIYQAIKQVLTNCLEHDKVNVNKLTLFDLEYLFLKLRAVSVSNIVPVTYKDKEDDKDYEFKVNLDELNVKFHDDYKPVIQLGADKGFTMRYPLSDMYAAPIFSNKDATMPQIEEEVILHCIDSYFDGEKVYNFSKESRTEQLKFLDNLGISTYNLLREHLSHLPTLHYKIVYTNSLDHERTIEMSSLSDFFTL